MAHMRLDLTLNFDEEKRWRRRFKGVIRKQGKLTHFSNEELEALLIVYKKLTKVKPIDRAYFRKIMYALFYFQNNVLIDQIFSAMDIHSKQALTMDAWIKGMSVILRGSLEEKIRFCFSVYDMMGDGYIRKEHMFQALRSTIRSSSQDDDHEEVVKDMIEILMKRMDRDRDGKLSFDDYRESVWENPDLLEVLGYCLPSRPSVYAFMTTFTDRVTTMHATMYRRRNLFLKERKLPQKRHSMTW